MARYLMKMMYDGSCFHGWQIQPGVRTVQSELEKALEEMSGYRIEVTGSGRTDTGVHALAQTAHFDYEGSMKPYQIVLALRNLLYDAVRVFDVVPVPDGFHARYDAMQRHYRYLLAKDKNPFIRNYMGFVPNQTLILERMLPAAKYFLGVHDYSSFARPNPNIPNRICDLKELTITEHTDHFCFEIRADRFLHNMVRRIVGSLISISHKNLAPRYVQNWFEDISPRQNLVFTAPAAGVYLVSVQYPMQ